MEAITDFNIVRMSLQLVVGELERAVEFYTEKLGFRVDFRYEDFYVGIVKDGYSIHLKHGVPSAEIRKNIQENEHLDMLLSVDDVEGVYELMCAESVNIVQPLREMPYGKEFYIADPDGYILAFMGQK